MTITPVQRVDRIIASIDQILAETTVRTNPFAHVTGVDELGAPIVPATAPIVCENQ